MPEYRRVRVISEEAMKPEQKMEVAKDQAQEAQKDARETIQQATIDRQIESIKKRNESQIENLQRRKQRVAGINEEFNKKNFFLGNDGAILNYLVNGELALIDPQYKSLAKKFKRDPAIAEMVEKLKAQLSAEIPNESMLKILKYKIVSRIEMLERLETSREGV
jgi:hypothetical protein